MKESRGWRRVEWNAGGQEAEAFGDTQGTWEI